MSSLFKEIEAIREQRLRSTAIATLSFVLLLSTLFITRAIQWEIEERVLSISICMLLVAIGLIVLLRGGSRLSASFFGIAGCCIAAVYSTYSSGGLNNPSAAWLIFLPLIASLVGGKIAAMVGFAFSLSSIVLLYVLQERFGIPPDLTPLEFRENQARLNQLGQLVLVFLAIFVLFRQVKRSEESLSTNLLRLDEEVKARRVAEEKAEQANAIKSAFLANMSHEIRTPMNGVIGMLQVLKNSHLNPDQEKQLNIAIRSAESLLVVINDILDVSKIDAGKLEIESIEFNLLNQMNDVVAMCSHTIPSDAEVVLVADVEGIHYPNVIGDPVRVQQIISNILSNAIKFTASGEIRLTARVEKERENELRFICKIKDSGIGIASDELPNLFDEFSQADASTTRKFGGTGLGLSICKKLCELMNGSISVESELGKGSCFTVEITLLEGTSQDTTASHDKHLEQKLHEVNEDSSFVGRKILLVEDNEVNQIVAKYMLDQLNLCTDVSINGIEAIERLQQNTYELVLMDCQMPQMDGYEATARIRRGEAGDRNKNIPIIALTANAMKGDKEKCLEAGMNDYLAKPFEERPLRNILSKWMRGA